MAKARTEKSETRARATKLTAERRRRLLDALSRGHHRTTACALAGINDRTLRTWLRRADDGDPRYAELARSVREAEAGTEEIHLGRILSAGVEDWRATAWWAERRFPDRWGDRVRIELAGALEEIMAAAKEALDADSYARLLAALEARLPRAGERQAK